MSEYELVVTWRVPNPAYRPKLSGYCYSNQQEEPQYTEVRTVTVTLTQAEYDKVRQALITHWTTQP